MCQAWFASPYYNLDAAVCGAGLRFCTLHCMHCTSRLISVLEVFDAHVTRPLCANPRQAARAAPIDAARRPRAEGPQRGSSAALEVLLSSPRSSTASPLLAESVAQPPSWGSGVLRTEGGAQEAAPFLSTGSASAPLPRPHQPQNPAVAALLGAPGNRSSAADAAEGGAASGSVLDRVSSVPETPPSPFMVARREAAGGASLGSAGAFR